MKNVLITGATGFVGSRLCEVLHLTGVFKPVALVHSAASAARIARLPIDCVRGDLLDKASLQRGAQGCQAVVHLARGDRRVMRRGLKNVLEVAVAGRMERFVHVSSVAVYGDTPSQDCSVEAPLPKKVNNPYGNEKLRQERLVEHFHRRTGLPTVILRPPNIYGPFSHFTVDLIERLRDKNLPLVGEGETPCNVVYIDNLIEAILLALWKPQVSGEAFFVTDSETPTWARFLSDYANMLGVDVPRVSAEELKVPVEGGLLRESLRQTPRVLFSSEFRSVLKRIPLAQRAEVLARSGFDSLPPRLRDYFYYMVNGTEVIERNGRSPFYATDNLILAQRRGVAHSSAKARRLLGYKASVTPAQGKLLTQEWLRFARLI